MSTGDSSTDSSSSRGGRGNGTAASAQGASVELPKTDTARTSTKFVSQEDKEGAASWEEEFFFSRVAGETAVRIVCVDKVCCVFWKERERAFMRVCYCCLCCVSSFVVHHYALISLTRCNRVRFFW